MKKQANKSDMKSVTVRHPKPNSTWLKSIKQSQLITRNREIQVYTKLKASDCMPQWDFIKRHIPPK